MENPYDGDYSLGDHQGVAYVRVQDKQQEGMETEHKQGNIEDGRVGCCVQLKRGCVKLDDGLGPRPRGYVDLVGYCVCGRELDYIAHLSNFLPFVSLPAHSSLPQMSKCPNDMHYLLSCIIYA